LEREFEGKVVLVTGGARGLGRATARIFAERGASLFLVDVLAETLEDTRGEIEALGAPCRAHVADISRREACHGAGGLDVLCNVAATLRFHHVTDVTQEDWERVMAVNLSAPFYFSQAAIPHLLARKGNIVNVASQAASIGCAYIVPYSASKGALVQMTRSMAMEFMNQPIRINAVAPGTMRTDIGQGVTRPDDVDLSLMARYSGVRPPSEAEDVAELIVFAASERARAIHGALLTADGGVTAG
jgi:NAD(P)-dependent dehydrogenase (short-subunit alcohol dehydrogenase family)